MSPNGPLILIATHPFGLVDGAIFLYLTTRVRKVFFLLINEVMNKRGKTIKVAIGNPIPYEKI